MSTDHERTFRRPPVADWESWGVGSTPMLESEAEAIAAYICDAYPQVHAFAVDPHSCYTLGLDRWTAEMLRDSMAAFEANGGDVGNILADLKAWLEATAP